MTELAPNTDFVCGTVAIVGRPNVGKSTLLNRLVGQKLSITSKRPQTTRHRLLGLRTDEQSQLVFVDTPGYQTLKQEPLHRVMNRAAAQTGQDTDLVLLVVDGKGWNAADAQVASLLKPSQPVFLVINKVDRYKDPAKLQALVVQAQTQTRLNFLEWYPLAPPRAGR
jgi:GTPase